MNNLELSGSFIIGGIILFLLMGYFFFYGNFSQSKTINEINLSNSINIQEVIHHDFSKIGYRSGSSPVLSIDSSSVAFKADLDNDGSPELIYYSQSDGLTRLINPSGYSYTVPNVEEFNVIGYDSAGIYTTIAANVKCIELKLALNSKKDLSDTNFTAYSYFTDKFYIKEY